MKENGFYVMLALVSALGLLALGLLVFKAARLPNYDLSRENITTTSAYPQATESPQPIKE